MSERVYQLEFTIKYNIRHVYLIGCNFIFGGKIRLFMSDMEWRWVEGKSFSYKSYSLFLQTLINSILHFIICTSFLDVCFQEVKENWRETMGMVGWIILLVLFLPSDEAANLPSTKLIKDFASAHQLNNVILHYINHLPSLDLAKW